MVQFRREILNLGSVHVEGDYVVIYWKFWRELVLHQNWKAQSRREVLNLGSVHVEGEYVVNY